MKQTAERDVGAEGRAQNKKTGLMRGHEWLQRLFLHERLLFTPSISFFVSISLSLAFSLAVWRASAASLASSQEVKLNCRASLPNDERLWHPGMLWAWTKSSEREKMLAFQLNTFFLLHFFSLAFFGVGFSIIGASDFFFPFFLWALAPQPWSKSSSWETGGWMEVVRRRRAKGWAEKWVFMWECVCMCELLGCRDAAWTWVCSCFYCHQCFHSPHSQVHVWTQWFKSVFTTKIKKPSVFPQISLPHDPIYNDNSWL